MWVINYKHISILIVLNVYIHYCVISQIIIAYKIYFKLDQTSWYVDDVNMKYTFLCVKCMEQYHLI